MHGRKYRNAADDVRRRLRELGVHRARRRRRRSASRRSGSVSRIPAPKDVFRADGPAADLGAPYVLTVATLEPRKNLQVLVEAHRLLGGDLQLAVVGAEGWGEQPLLDGPRIRRLGYVSDEELARLYRGAAVVAYPSRFEGFGIPVIEAMACGAPVVVSSHESLDEASGDAAVRADPEDPAAFAAAIERASAERERLVAARPRARRSVLLARGRRDLPPRLRGGARDERRPGDRRRRASRPASSSSCAARPSASATGASSRAASSPTRRRARRRSASSARRPGSRRRSARFRSRSRTRCSTTRRRSGLATRRASSASPSTRSSPTHR